MLAPSTNCTEPPLAERVTVWEVASEELVIVWSPVFVPVAVPPPVAKSASVQAVLNCAIVPLTVLEPRAIVLFVRVSVEEIVGTATVPLLILPVPFGFMLISTFVSHPVASIIGQFPVAALDMVNSFTADATEVRGNLISSFKAPSFIPRLVVP